MIMIPLFSCSVIKLISLLYPCKSENKAKKTGPCFGPLELNAILCK